jgi:hypothetical protein
MQQTFRLKKSLVFLFLVFFFTICSIAQHSISGIITDTVSNEPLPFASIITNNNQGTVSGIDGKFELTAQQKNHFDQY